MSHTKGTNIYRNPTAVRVYGQHHQHMTRPLTRVSEDPSTLLHPLPSSSLVSITLRTEKGFATREDSRLHYLTRPTESAGIHRERTLSVDVVTITQIRARNNWSTPCTHRVHYPTGYLVSHQVSRDQAGDSTSHSHPQLLRSSRPGPFGYEPWTLSSSFTVGSPHTPRCPFARSHPG